MCYKIFHHLRRNKKSKTKCLEEADAESEISEVGLSIEGCHSTCSGSFGDGEASTDTLSLTDSEDDVVMGLSPSSHLEPVFFSKNSGIHFRKPPICPSTPVDVLGGSPRFSWLEQSNDTSLSYEYDGAASLRGNFSPGSLQERTRRTQEFLESSGDEFFSDSKLPQYHRSDSIGDSVVFYSERSKPLCRQSSVDCEEMGTDIQRRVEAIGRATVQKMEHLDNQLQELKQTVLDLDADIVGLKVYRQPPQKCWELTNISSSSDTGSGIVDVIQHHWTKVWCKGLASPRVQKDEEDLEDMARNILDWEYILENSADSGSDFGNSFDTDSVEPESASTCGVILEWDHQGLPDGPSVDTIDSKIETGTSAKRKLKMLSRSVSEDSNLKRMARKHRSMSTPPQLLAQQIKRVIRTPLLVAEIPSSTDPGASGDASACRLATSLSIGSSGESGFQEVEKSARGQTPREEVVKVLRDSAYCEGMDVVPTQSIGDPVSMCVFQSLIGQEETSLKACEHLVSIESWNHVRRIRIDGYCVLRATLYQCLSNGIPIISRYGAATTVNDLLCGWSKESSPWLKDWTFGGVLPCRGPEGFLEILGSLQELENSLMDVEDRQQRLASVLNSDPNLDLRVMEAVKLLMLVSAVKLCEAGQRGPVFYSLLFAQLEPSWPLERLDRIGGNNTDQADLYLLGYALSTTLKVLHLQRFGEVDFTCHYPECNLGEWPEVTLLMDNDCQCIIPSSS